MKKYRLFAALELLPELIERLTALQAEFKAALPRGAVRWSRPKGMHLTLKFYGEVAAERVPAIEAGLQRAALMAEPVTLTVQGLGVFPNPREPQVVWAGLTGDLAIVGQLVSAIEAEGEQLGFTPERRPFTPHLTLGRVKAQLRPADHTALLQFLEGAQGQLLGELRADTLNLMTSELRPLGAVYERIFSAPLGPAPAGAA